MGRNSSNNNSNILQGVSPFAFSVNVDTPEDTEVLIQETKRALRNVNTLTEKLNYSLTLFNISILVVAICGVAYVVIKGVHQYQTTKKPNTELSM